MDAQERRLVAIPADLSKPMVEVVITGLKGLQKTVGGFWERVTTQRLYDLTRLIHPHHSSDSYLGMSVNEDGHDLGLPHNLRAEYFSGYPGQSGILGNVAIHWEGYTEGGRDILTMPRLLAGRLIALDAPVTDMIRKKFATDGRWFLDNPSLAKGMALSPVPQILELPFPPNS